MEVREIRNRTMHATFTDIYISSDILKEKYNRIVGLFCIFISIMDKLSKVLSNTTVGMQKFVLNKDKPTIESIKRIK
jgi:predicted transcriptional regulator YheO